MNFKKLTSLLASFSCIFSLFFLAPSLTCKADNLPHPMRICDIFPDPALAKEMVRHLKKTSVTEVVSQKELNEITIFDQLFLKKDRQSSVIFSLEGLNYLNNLKLLATSGRNQISDIKPLQHLYKLESIYLAANQIVDISPLSHLINLRGMQLSYNKINNIKALENLENLRALDLNYNEITDFGTILKLKNLVEFGFEGGHYLQEWGYVLEEDKIDMLKSFEAIQKERFPNNVTLAVSVDTNTSDIEPTEKSEEVQEEPADLKSEEFTEEEETESEETSSYEFSGEIDENWFEKLENSKG